MQVNLNSNNQQNQSFGMIGIQIKKGDVLVKHTASAVLDKTMSEMEKRNLVKIGVDKSFNSYKYITLPLNCPEETHILNKVKADGFVNIEQVEDTIAKDNIKRQEAYLDILDTIKTKPQTVENKLKKLFPGFFSK